jgi:hypothetical protein
MVEVALDKQETGYLEKKLKQIIIMYSFTKCLTTLQKFYIFILFFRTTLNVNVSETGIDPKYPKAS